VIRIGKEHLIAQCILVSAMKCVTFVPAQQPLTVCHASKMLQMWEEHAFANQTGLDLLVKHIWVYVTQSAHRAAQVQAYLTVQYV
jgi:hypothetical protein